MNERTIRFVFACTLASSHYDPSAANITELIVGRRGTRDWCFYRKVAMLTCVQLGVDCQLLADTMGRPYAGVRQIVRQAADLAEKSAGWGDEYRDRDPFLKVWRVMTPSGCDVIGDPTG